MGLDLQKENGVDAEDERVQEEAVRQAQVRGYGKTWHNAFAKKT
jgi:hypothetical protein